MAFSSARLFANFKELRQCGCQKLLFDAGVVHVDNSAHRVHVGKADVVKETAAQEGVGQFLFVVGGDDDDGAVTAESSRRSRRRRTPSGRVPAADRSETRCRPCRSRRSAARLFVRPRRLPTACPCGCSWHVVHLFFAQLAVAQAANGVIFIKALLRAGGGFDVPFNHTQPKRGDLRASSVLPVPGSP